MRLGDGTMGPRLRAGAATLLIHSLLIALLLRTGVVPPAIVDERSLTLFDLPLPDVPPPPPPEIARPPEPQRTQPQPAEHPRLAGGATPAATQPRPAVDLPTTTAMNVTLAPDALPALPPSASPTGNAAADGASGSGGKGQGSGTGAGNGDQLEGGAAQRFQRAEWITRPTDEQINRYWPAEAIRRKIGGRVYLACAFTHPGKPDRCISIFEAPTGVGFGEAAVKLSKTFRIRPIRINDRDAADLPVIVPVTFTAKR